MNIDPDRRKELRESIKRKRQLMVRVADRLARGMSPIQVGRFLGVNAYQARFVAWLRKSGRGP